MDQNKIELKPHIIFITGSSGSGKTSLVNALNKKLNNTSIVCFHFDSIGVPSEQKMIEQYGPPSEWQRAMTHIWIEKIMQEHHDKMLVIIEGQVNLSFIVTAFKNMNFNNYEIILMHCENSIRHARLRINRHQPELINETMDNWSSFLKSQALEMDVPIIDTTSLSIENIVTWFLQYIKIPFELRPSSNFSKLIS